MSEFTLFFQFAFLSNAEPLSRKVFFLNTYFPFFTFRLHASIVGPFLLRFKSVLDPFLRMGGKWELQEIL